MANACAMARSNYFRVKSRESFEEFLALFTGLQLIEDEQGRVGFLAHEGTPLDFVVDEETGEEDHVDFVGELAGHLRDGEVAIVMEIGWEKMRYLSGFATAVNNQLDQVNVDVSDIYVLAKELTARPDDVTAVEY